MSSTAGNSSERFSRLAERPAAPVALFALVVVAFLAVGIQERSVLGPVEEYADRIAREAAPGIELLAGVRAEARTLPLLVSAYESGPTVEHRAALETASNALHDRLTGYSALPELPGEAADSEALRLAEVRLRQSVGVALARGAPSAPPGDAPRVSAEVTHLSDLASRLIAAKAEQSARLANRISSAHRHAARVGFALDAACLGLAAMAAFLSYRLRLRNDALARARLSNAVERATELGLFASRVAHDIRSPLQAAKLAVQVERRNRSAEPERGAMLERAGRSVDRVLSITDALLDFAQAGARPTMGEEADVGEVVNDVVAELEPIAESAKVALVATSPARCIVSFSTGALNSLVSNLVRNAIKYMGDRPERRVDIRVTKEARTARIEVEDTGPGVAPELGDTIFELYARGTTTQPGLGLGLATAKRLVDAHGGRIGYRARAGSGTVFWVELALADATARAPLEQPVSMPDGRSS